MRLRVGEIDGARLAGHEADQALVGAHHGVVDGVAVEAFGGVKFQRGIDAQHIDGAHLRNHVGGDQHHDLVKAFLRADRLRHRFAKPAQQHARTAERAAHGVRSLGPYLTGAQPVSHRPSSKRNSPGTRRPAAIILKAISNAVCRSQAEDKDMTQDAANLCAATKKGLERYYAVALSRP